MFLILGKIIKSGLFMTKNYISYKIGYVSHTFGFINQFWPFKEQSWLPSLCRFYFWVFFIKNFGARNAKHQAPSP
jgi:hypothetical protein